MPTVAVLLLEISEATEAPVATLWEPQTRPLEEMEEPEAVLVALEREAL